MIESFKIVQTDELISQQKKQVLDLWNNEYPEKLSHASINDFENYLSSLSSLTHYLMTSDDDLIFGWALTFEREKEKWFAIILDEKIKGIGLGRKMLDKLKQAEPVLNGWVIDHNNDKKKNGETYLSPLPFYKKCGFEILDQESLELENISAVKIRWISGKG